MSIKDQGNGPAQGPKIDGRSDLESTADGGIPGQLAGQSPFRELDHLQFGTDRTPPSQGSRQSPVYHRSFTFAVAPVELVDSLSDPLSQRGNRPVGLKKLRGYGEIELRSQARDEPDRAQGVATEFVERSVIRDLTASKGDAELPADLLTDKAGHAADFGCRGQLIDGLERIVRDRLQNPGPQPDETIDCTFVQKRGRTKDLHPHSVLSEIAPDDPENAIRLIILPGHRFKSSSDQVKSAAYIRALVEDELIRLAASVFISRNHGESATRRILPMVQSPVQIPGNLPDKVRQRPLLENSGPDDHTIAEVSDNPESRRVFPAIRHRRYCQIVATAVGAHHQFEARQGHDKKRYPLALADEPKLLRQGGREVMGDDLPGHHTFWSEWSVETKANYWRHTRQRLLPKVLKNTLPKVQEVFALPGADIEKLILQFRQGYVPFLDQ